MEDIVISASGVGKCYRVFDDERSRLLHAMWPGYTKGMQEVWALKDINFEIRRGESVAIIGHNGGGKSTLLEILTGTSTPSTGAVRVNGRVSALLELGSGFNPEYSGRDNVVLNGLLLGLSRAEILDRFNEIEAFAEIGVAIDRPVKTYSSGMMLRLAFAVQVICDPEILVIDEALSVGDFFFQQKCLGYIKKLCDSGVTLLFVSHDMGTVRDLCGRGVFLSRGHVGYDGDKLEAIRRYLQPESEKSEDLRQVAVPSRVIVDGLYSRAIPSPFWLIDSDALLSKQATAAYVVAVGIVDERDEPRTFAVMGAKIRIRIHYKSNDMGPVHVHMVVKNKYDQVVTAIGSHNLGTQPPVLAAGEEAIFELTVKMSLEAGEYGLNFSLVRPSVAGIAGETLDESPWLGPFQVRWDYLQDVPPFYGMIGLECSARYLE